ncbi:hypothetical protein [Streptomyces acidicola]
MTMRLASRANWWAPRPLRRLHEWFGISEEAGKTTGESSAEGVLRREYV